MINVIAFPWRRSVITAPAIITPSTLIHVSQVHLLHPLCNPPSVPSVGVGVYYTHGVDTRVLVWSCLKTKWTQWYLSLVSFFYVSSSTVCVLLLLLFLLLLHEDEITLSAFVAQLWGKSKRRLEDSMVGSGGVERERERVINKAANQ